MRTRLAGLTGATLEQVQQSASRLLLKPGLCLLDIGAGSGWPALLLATQSGCDVVLTDLPLSGLRVARALPTESARFEFAADLLGRLGEPPRVH